MIRAGFFRFGYLKLHNIYLPEIQFLEGLQGFCEGFEGNHIGYHTHTGVFLPQGGKDSPGMAACPAEECPVGRRQGSKRIGRVPRDNVQVRHGPLFFIGVQQGDRFGIPFQAYTVPRESRRAASTLTDPVPAPTS